MSHGIDMVPTLLTFSEWQPTSCMDCRRSALAGVGRRQLEVQAML